MAALLDTNTDTKMTRGQVIKNIWNYIKEHNLKDPEDPNYIIPDEKIAAVFGKEKFCPGFEMAKWLGRHYKSNFVSTFDTEQNKIHVDSEG